MNANKIADVILSKTLETLSQYRDSIPRKAVRNMIVDIINTVFEVEEDSGEGIRYE